MFSVRVTAQDGSIRVVPFNGMRCTIGRDASSDVVLEGSAVSGHHCVLEVVGQTCRLSEVGQGSTNGTFLNNARLTAPTELTERDSFYVGSFLLQLVREAPALPSDYTPYPPADNPQFGEPLLRPSANRAWRDEHGRLQRYAEQWDSEGQPARLILDPTDLGHAQRWLKQERAGMIPEVTALQREFIEASAKANKARGLRTALLVILSVAAALGIIAGTYVFAWDSIVELTRNRDDDTPALVNDATPGPGPDAENGGSGGESGDEDEDDQAKAPATRKLSKEEREVKKRLEAELEHVVIPFETVEDVAKRYGVRVAELVGWNHVNPDADLVGQTLIIKRPKRRPLPQTKIMYEVEKRENWAQLAKRFDISIKDLRAYNPDYAKVKKLEPGTTLAIWIDPKPYKPKDPTSSIPSMPMPRNAVSVGTPQNGSLQNGVQMPESPAYKRRSPWHMYGSGFAVGKLREGIAAFRRDVDYQGTLIVSDLSRRSGGHAPPHKSHQSGRDVDIWLPTIKGVYKTKYLAGGKEGQKRKRPRRPMRDEVDWYATWGLVRALIKTEAVEYVFLDWRYQHYVYRAAVVMGATQEQLDKWIQWPRPKNATSAIFRHSEAHLSHIHVRFKCAPWERGTCHGKTAKP